MPSLSILAAPGSSYRVLSLHGIRVSLSGHSSRSRTPQQTRFQSICVSRHNWTSPRLRIYDACLPIAIPKINVLGRRCNSIGSRRDRRAIAEEPTPFKTRAVRDGKQIKSRARQVWYSRRSALRSRPSQNLAILNSIRNHSRDIYAMYNPLEEKHTSRGRQRLKKCPLLSIPAPICKNDDDAMEAHLSFNPVSLHSILGRHLHAVTTSQEDQPQPSLSTEEKRYLASQGYTAESVEQWSESILENDSVSAASLFKITNEKPPLFLVMFFLRRKRIRYRALGIIIRHLQSWAQHEDISWPLLTKLLLRLMRHARLVWPEAIPWIATFFTTEATRIYADLKGKKSFIAQLSRMTKFSNMMLQWLSLPVSINPFVNSRHQETAMFQVLRFMTSCEPALTVTQPGFRAMARNQLARPKTAQEREWARLKGPSWPPWKENRNAMDEEKGYEFGASRASRILHRMFEAGYQGDAWEKIAEIYAGWDTDRSPTIQWRTLYPHNSTSHRRPNKPNTLLWVSRIRVTRTRREAWACFLACEASGKADSAQVYLAIFKKLHAPVLEEQNGSNVGYESEYAHHDQHLPGDTEEVMPEAQSPYHHVYLREPIPSFEQLYHRMETNNVSVTARLLAFLIETLPDLSTTLRLLEAEQSAFDGGLAVLMNGSVFSREGLPVPGYLFTSFIRFLCRFGRSDRPPSTTPLSLPPNIDDHRLRLHSEAYYRIEYAQALLMHYRPADNSAWEAYVQTIQFQRRDLDGHDRVSQKRIRAAWQVKQYRSVCNVFRILEELDADAHDSLFRRLCIVARDVTLAAHQDLLSHEDKTHILSTVPRFVRFAFHNLVGVDIDPDNLTHPLQEHAIPPHIPDPSTLHAYARTLGVLRDHEGLYSLSIWATTHHEQITALAHEKKDGSTQLFRMLVALRAGLAGKMFRNKDVEPASPDLVELVKAKIKGVEGWSWPNNKSVQIYRNSSYYSF